MITDIKRAIITQLQPLSSKVRIIADDTEGEAGSASNVRQDYILRVGYAGATFEPPETTESVDMQKGSRAFQVSVEIRDLRSEDKAVEILEEAEELILGFCPCIQGTNGEFYLQNDRFQQNKEGVYYYVINVAISCIVIKKYG